MLAPRGVPGGDPPGRPLLRAERILLECILGFFFSFFVKFLQPQYGGFHHIRSWNSYGFTPKNHKMNQKLPNSPVANLNRVFQEFSPKSFLSVKRKTWNLELSESCIYYIKSWQCVSQIKRRYDVILRRGIMTLGIPFLSFFSFFAYNFCL